MLFKDIVFRGMSIVSGEKIASRFYNTDTSLRFHNRLEKLKDWLIQQINAAEKGELHKQWVQEEIELLSNEEYEKARIHLAKNEGLKKKK